LEEILDKTKIHLKKRPNWRELEKKFKLGYGRNYDESKDKVADKKAFIINDCEFDIFTSDEYYYDKITISSTDELIRNKSLLLKAQTEMQYAKLGFSIGSEKISQDHSGTSSIVQFKNFGKAEISIREQDIKPTTEFQNAVQEAIDSRDPKKINKIIVEFGQFIPTIVRFGGRLHYKDITRTTKNSANDNKEGSANLSVYGQGLESQYKSNVASGSENIMQREDSTIFGGDKTKIYESKEEEWVTSLQDFSYWEPIEFRKPVSIFEFLNKNLKKEIKEIIGKRIIYSNVQDYSFKINNLRNHIAELKMPRDMEKVFSDSDIDSQVFATILNLDENNDIFTYTLYTPEPFYIPKIIINCIQSNYERQKKCHIKIGWIIVGYNTSFNSVLSSFDIHLQSTKKKIHTLSNNSNEKHIFKISEDNLLVACGAPVVFDWSPGCERLVIGHHFSLCKTEKKTFTCLYGYDLDEKNYSILPNFEFNILFFVEHPISEIFDQFKIDRKSSEKKNLLSNFKKNKNKKQETDNDGNKLPEFVSLYADNKNECQQCFPEFIAKKFERFILEQPKCKNALNRRLHDHCFASVFNPEVVKKQKII
ncbi:7589_t:CDS:1, partial [Scutellospora calospora]